MTSTIILINLRELKKQMVLETIARRELGAEFSAIMDGTQNHMSFDALETLDDFNVVESKAISEDEAMDALGGAILF